MHTPQPPKRNPNTLVIHIDQTKVRRGHQAHNTGSGVHGDRRTKRCRTRSAQRRNAIGEW